MSALHDPHLVPHTSHQQQQTFATKCPITNDLHPLTGTRALATVLAALTAHLWKSVIGIVGETTITPDALRTRHQEAGRPPEMLRRAHGLSTRPLRSDRGPAHTIEREEEEEVEKEVEEPTTIAMHRDP